MDIIVDDVRILDDGRGPSAGGLPRVAAGIHSRKVVGTNMRIDELLQSDVKVVNIGLREFARDLERTGTPVIHVDWSPPPVRDPKIASLLAKLGG
jgi:hypothetical protein